MQWPEPHALPLQFAGESFLLDAQGVLFAPQKRTLIVSDLHLEKASFLQLFGHPIPTLDSHDTLLRLQHVIGHYNPETVICLGDSWHDTQAGQRMSEDDQSLLSRLCQSVQRWVWVLGNHDPALPHFCKGEQTAHVQLGDIRLCHEPEATPSPQIVGHYHPKTSITLRRGHKAKGRCFLSDNALLIMPSFGSYTGGLDASHDAIRSLFAHDPTVHLLHSNKVWHIT